MNVQLKDDKGNNLYPTPAEHDHGGQYAAAGHNHDSKYALASHVDFTADNAHIGHVKKYGTIMGGNAYDDCVPTAKAVKDYAATKGHNHDGTYQPAGNYVTTSTHDRDIAGLATSISTHNHDTKYQAKGSYVTQTTFDAHNHDTKYQEKGNYALTGHIHSEYLTTFSGDRRYSLAIHTHDNYAVKGHTHTASEISGLSGGIYLAGNINQLMSTPSAALGSVSEVKAAIARYDTIVFKRGYNSYTVATYASDEDSAIVLLCIMPYQERYLMCKYTCHYSGSTWGVVNQSTFTIMN